MTRGPFGLTAAALLAGSLLLALSTPAPARAQAARADIRDAKGESLGQLLLKDFDCPTLLQTEFGRVDNFHRACGCVPGRIEDSLDKRMRIRNSV